MTKAKQVAAQLTASQERNLVALYLWPHRTSVNGATWGGLHDRGLVEQGYTQDPRLSYHRCTPAGRTLAKALLQNRLELIEEEEYG